MWDWIEKCERIQAMTSESKTRPVHETDYRSVRKQSLLHLLRNPTLIAFIEAHRAPSNSPPYRPEARSHSLSNALYGDDHHLQPKSAIPSTNNPTR
jgi:hypothetical protein